MKEIESLFQRAKKYVSSADLLLKAKDFESSVSRSYYAMFFVAEAALLSRNVAASSHKGVIAEFNRVFIRGGELPNELGRSLAVAFEKRQLGDYEATPVISREEARAVLAEAKKFVKRLAAFLGQK